MNAHTIRRYALRAAMLALLAGGTYGCKKPHTTYDKFPSQETLDKAEANDPHAYAHKADENGVNAEATNEGQDTDATQDADKAPSLDDVLAADRRSDAHKARDVWRHPKQTLEFFGLKPDMTVLEVGPGSGWYTEILAPYLQKNGQLIEGLRDPEGPNAKYRKGWKTLAKTDEALYGDVKEIVFDPPRFQNVPDGTVDLVLVTRQIHGWQTSGGSDGIAAGFKAAFQALKPGGVLGVTDHRAKPDTDPAETAQNGYLPQAYVIKVAEAAGFELGAKSELNANPKDTTDHPNGVWSLPPTLRNDTEEQNEAMKKIGESDRMTLRFVKPADDNAATDSGDNDAQPKADDAQADDDAE